MGYSTGYGKTCINNPGIWTGKNHAGQHIMMFRVYLINYLMKIKEKQITCFRNPVFVREKEDYLNIITGFAASYKIV